MKNTTNNVLTALMAYKDNSLQFNREISCFVVPNKGIISMSTNNNAGGVEFDFFNIWEQIKKLDTKPNYVYMLHSHPPYLNKMSSIDENMVQGWATALGIPIYFIIITPSNLTAYRCELEKTLGIKHVSMKFYTDIDLLDDKSCLAYSELCMVSKIIYGFSKLEPLETDNLDKVAEYINESGVKIS